MSTNHSLQIDPSTQVNITPPRDQVATRRRTTRSSINHALQQIQNPDPILKKLGKDITAYRDLLMDGHLSSCVQSRKSGVLSLEWEISMNRSTQEIYDFIVDVFDKLDMHKILGEMLDAPLYGYSFHEVDWVLIDGRWRATDIIAKPQEWFKFNDENEALFISNDDRKGVTLPANKFLILQHQASYVNPYGQALLSRCFWPVSFKNQMIKFGLQFAEKYGMPYLFGKYDEMMNDPSTIAALQSALEELSAMGIATIPQSTSAELLEAGRSSSVDTYMRFITMFNAEVSKAILSQTLTTEQGDTGSYAMSQTHLMVRQDVVESDKRLCENAINQLIRWIVEFNFLDAEAPVFRMYEEQDVDAALADRDTKLFALGFRPNKKYISSQYNISEDEFDLVDPTAAAPAAPAMHADPVATAYRSVRVPAIGRGYLQEIPNLQENGARAISGTVSKFSAPDGDAGNAAMEAMLKPVVDMIQKGHSYEELNSKLAEIFPDMDDEALIDQLSDAMFIADTIGRISTQ